MEDNGRELDTDPVNTPPVKDGHQSSEELTIMLIGSVGKMRSFKISRKLIRYTSILLFLYIIASLLVFYLYFDLYSANKAQSNSLKNLEAELSDKTKTLEKNKLYIKGLEDFYNASKKGIEGKTDEGVTLKKSSQTSRPKATDSDRKKSKEAAKKEIEKKADTGGALKKTPDPGRPEEKKAEETISKEKEIKADTGTVQKEIPEPPGPETKTPDKTETQDIVREEAVKDPMEVREIQFKRTDSDLTLDFKLANRLAEQKAVEGYIHIIVMDKDKECPPEWNSSYNKLTDGFPVNYMHGQQFLIQRFRPYQRQYKTNPDSELPFFIRILVYDRSGQKILEKEFPVTDESENDQS